MSVRKTLTMNINFILLCLPLFIFACSSSKNELYIKGKVNETWGSDVQRVQSPEGHYTLHVSEEVVADGQKLLKFIVVENKTDELIFQDSLPNASLSWHSDTLLLVEQRLGIVQKDVSENGIRRFLLSPANGQKKLIPYNPDTH